jgi:serine/threonine-protein kinase
MDRDTFFRHLRRSRLLSEPEVDEAARLTDSGRGRAVARALVGRGLLTRFQAGRLLAGRPGRLLLGQYRLLDRLGRGGTGRVFKAVHRTMARVVAIKVILRGLLEDPSAIDLFNREVRAAAQLHHPNIVTAYDANEIKGTRFLVMEYVDGPSLQDLIQGRGPLPVELACELVRQAAVALQYAHEKGLVHRDVKPANLLLAHLGRLPDRGWPDAPAPWPVVKVVDFGLARVRSAGAGQAGGVDTIQAEPGAVCGTIDYISPEQAHDIHGADIRSDLYSLGCTFYQALTGQVPFPGGNPMEKLLKQLMNDPPPLRSLRPEVPPAVEALVGRLMAKDPGQRFQTPGELARELVSLSGTAGRRAAAAEPASGGAGPGPETSFPSAVFKLPTDAALREAATLIGDDPLLAGSGESPLDPAFREKFRQWTALVEYTLRHRGAFRHINREAFAALQRQLLRACRALACVADDERRTFFQRLEERLKPWLSPQALAQTDLEIHYQLVEEFQQDEQELDRWMVKADDRTTLGRLLTLFKGRQQTDVRTQLRQIFGVKW